MQQNPKLNGAPHTYVTYYNGNYYISIIVPVLVGKRIVYDPITYLVTKTKINGTTIDDATSTEEYDKQVFLLNFGQTNPSKIEVKIDDNHATCDKYSEADDQPINIADGVANNSPHLFLGTDDSNTFYPKAIVPLKGYEFTGGESVVITSSENGIFEATVKLYQNPLIDQMFISPNLNTSAYLDEGQINGNSIAFVQLIDSPPPQSHSSSALMAAVGGPITRRKNKKTNKDA